jgi:hypothetical protein
MGTFHFRPIMFNIYIPHWPFTLSRWLNSSRLHNIPPFCLHSLDLSTAASVFMMFYFCDVRSRGSCNIFCYCAYLYIPLQIHGISFEHSTLDLYAELGSCLHVYIPWNCP